MFVFLCTNTVWAREGCCKYCACVYFLIAKNVLDIKVVVNNIQMFILYSLNFSKEGILYIIIYIYVYAIYFIHVQLQ